jgi:hypothetical protein
MHARSKLHVRLAPLLLPLWLAACATDKATPEAAAGASAAAVASAEADLTARAKASPRLGGSMTLVGEFQTELAIREDGSVEGLVFDADAKLVPPERVSAFSAMLALDGGALVPVALTWDAAAARFRGHADLGSTLLTNPVDVKLSVDGRTQTGVLEDYALLPKLELQANAKVKGLADAAVKLPTASATGSVQAGARKLRAAKASRNGHVKAGTRAAKVALATKPRAALSANAKASAKLDVPKPKVALASSKSVSKEKSGGGANVKARASLGFGQ